LCSDILQFLSISDYMSLYFAMGHFIYPFSHIDYLYQLLDEILIIVIIIVFRSPVTGFFTPVIFLLKATAIPTTRGTSFNLQYFLYYVWCSQYNSLLYWIYSLFSSTVFVFWSFLALLFIGQTAVVSVSKLTATELNEIELQIF